MATFEFLRMSLSIPKVGPLDTTSDAEPSETRAQYLTEIFSVRHDFFYRGNLYSYVPAPADLIDDEVFAGFIGRQRTVLEPDGPDHMFVLTPQKKWRAAFMVVDVSSRAQVVAIEKRTDVGASDSLVKHLIESVVSSRKSYTWHTDIEYITRKEEFWTAASKLRGRITELSFTFYPPNGLKGFEEFKKFDRLAKQQTNSELSEYALKNGAGAVLPEGEFVESAVEYASEGAGRITMKEGKKIVYNSRNSKLTEEVQESLMPREGESIKISGLARNLLQRLARDLKQ